MSAARHLSDDCRAQLCTGLGRALDAGLDPVSALGAVGDVCNGQLHRPLTLCANAIRKGSAMGVTLERQGLLSELDYALVSVSESAGRMAPVFERLGERYARAHARWRKMKGRLMLPTFIAFLGVLVLPIPALFAGKISTARYVLGAVAAIGLVIACVHLLRGLIARWRAHGSPTLLTRLARVLPGLRRLSLLHERFDVSEALALSLDAGLPASQALDNLLHGQFNGVRRANLVRARANLDGGVPLANALQEAGLLDSEGGFAIVSAGEQAGRLEQSLRHFARGVNDTLDNLYDLLAQWIPVVAYCIVAAVIAAGMLG